LKKASASQPILYAQVTQFSTNFLSDEIRNKPIGVGDSKLS
jgi:hypothetical protein